MHSPLARVPASLRFTSWFSTCFRPSGAPLAERVWRGKSGVLIPKSGVLILKFAHKSGVLIVAFFRRRRGFDTNKSID
jgi:hypothetical protein